MTRALTETSQNHSKLPRLSESISAAEGGVNSALPSYSVLKGRCSTTLTRADPPGWSSLPGLWETVGMLKKHVLDNSTALSEEASCAMLNIYSVQF